VFVVDEFDEFEDDGIGIGFVFVFAVMIGIYLFVGLLLDEWMEFKLFVDLI